MKNTLKYIAVFMFCLSGVTLYALTELERGLICASKEGHVKLVKEFICAGVDVDIRDEDGMTPLIHASREGHIKVAKVLICAGAEVDVRDKNGRVALMHVVKSHSNIEMLNLLLDNGADLEVRDAGGRTPLVCAVAQCNREMAKLFLDRGAEADARTINARTALMIAAYWDFEEMAMILLEKENSTNLEARDKNGETALMYTVKLSGKAKVPRLLLDRGADVNA